MKNRFWLLLAIVPLAAPANGEGAPQKFCERLAPQLHMKVVADEYDNMKPVWKMDTASIGMYLVGGTSSMKMGLHPIDTTNAAEFVRLDEACGVTRKGAICHIQGPARLGIETKRFKVSEDVADGEKAETEIRGTAILCRDKS